MQTKQHNIPNKDIESFKRTKIIATVGPSCNDYDSIYKIIEAGANGIRINFSHGDNSARLKQLKWVRKASKSLGKPVAIIQDLQGPKIRLGDFDGVIPVQTGQSLKLRLGADYEREGTIPVQYDLSKKVKRGERLYIYDGKVRTVVTSVVDDTVHVRVENDGILIARKGINLPDTDFGGDIITEKDKQDIVFGAENDFDYVALSFIQSASDIKALQRRLKNLNYPAKVIAKVETKAALDDIEDIVATADVTMVARGDLASETGAEVVPIAQRKIVGLGHKYGKITIIATQMLLSMTESPEPTRAEVNDVASAVLSGADVVMLSDETASGKFPIQSVETIKKIILYTEHNMPYSVSYNHEPVDNNTKAGSISNAILILANSIGAAAIVTETKSGATALNIASRRPEKPIIAVTSSERVSRQLALLYGCKSFVRRDQHSQGLNVASWMLQNKVFKKGDIVVISSGEHPGVVGTTDTIKVRALE